jgi:endonuclease G
MRIRFAHAIFSLFLLAPLLPAEDNVKFGQPACDQPLLDKKFFVVCHDPARKVPVWVEYALTKTEATDKATSRVGTFKPDANLPKGKRAENADYSNSGYDKGHMAPANDFTRSVEAMKSTFVLSNAVPQRHGVNGGKWAQLEAAVHALAAADGTVWVVSGPVFAGNKPVKTIGRDKVAVPTHTYKVVLHVLPSGDKEMFGFILPNINKPTGTLDSYTFSVSHIEKLTGLNFFDALPAAEQKKLEGASKTLPAQP